MSYTITCTVASFSTVRPSLKPAIEPVPISKTPTQVAISSLLYHLKTLYLFTKSDLKVILFPQSAIGIFQALSGSLILTNSNPRFLEIVQRVPLIAFWNWYNLLIFDLANQRLADSITEDRINKAWRPIPAGRIMPDQARQLLLILVPVGLLLSSCIGGFYQTLAILVLTYLYNDLGGANDHYLVRNLINAMGIVCYGSGSTLVAAGNLDNTALTKTAQQWLAITGAVMWSTLHVADLPDMKGDAARGRRTLPLALGEATARYSLAWFVMAWSFACPAFWALRSVWSCVPTFVLGGIVAFRTLARQNDKDDKQTYRLWCVWLICLYLLPLLRSQGL